MKMKHYSLLLLLVVMISNASAQHIRNKMNYPNGISIYASGPSPFSGAIWIGPEWIWRGNGYECVPGYWARPKHPKHHRRIPGYWEHSRRGYIWIPGRWK